MLRALAVTVALASSLVAGCGFDGSDAAHIGAQPSRDSSPSIATPSATPTPVAVRRRQGVAWVEDYEAVCVSLVRGVAPRRAVRLLTAGDAQPLAGRAEAEQWIDEGSDDDRYRIAVGHVGPWTFLWEDNGYDGSLAGVARRLSLVTSMVSFYWNVNADEQFTYAVHGRLVRYFDPVFYKRNGGVGKRLRKEIGMRWWSHPEVAMVRLQASLTGQPVANPSWLDGPDVTYWGSHL